MKLNPNCSEEVFRLSGSIEDIKREIINMLDCIKEEYLGEGMDSWRNRTLKEIKDMKKNIKKIENINELWNFMFPFTCNYETYFRPNKDGTVDVATCNNHIWDKVNYEPYYNGLDDTGYYEVSGERYMEIISKGYKWILLGIKNNKTWKVNGYLLLEIERERKISELIKNNYSSEIIVRKINNDTYYSYDNHGYKIELHKIKDKKKLNRIADKIMVDLI